MARPTPLGVRVIFVGLEGGLTSSNAKADEARKAAMVIQIESGNFFIDGLQEA
jgi:hypothetical protein